MTEIAPGMMVECIEDNLLPGRIYRPGDDPLSKGKIYLVTSFGNNGGCEKCGNCKTILISPVAAEGTLGWCITRFRPIGGDKEIEIEQSRKLNKSAKLLPTDNLYPLPLPTGKI